MQLSVKYAYTHMLLCAIFALKTDALQRQSLLLCYLLTRILMLPLTLHKTFFKQLSGFHNLGRKGYKFDHCPRQPKVLLCHWLNPKWPSVSVGIQTLSNLSSVPFKLCIPLWLWLVSVVLGAFRYTRVCELIYRHNYLHFHRYLICFLMQCTHLFVI